MNTSKDETVVRDGFWPKMARTAAHIPFAAEALAAYYCATDVNTPLKVKATLYGALAYFILPFDVIPDVIVGLGFADDMTVLVTAITLVRSHITADHHARAQDTLQELRHNPTTGHDHV